MPYVMSNPAKQKIWRGAALFFALLIPILVILSFWVPELPLWTALLPVIPTILCVLVAVAIGRAIRAGNYYGIITFRYVIALLTNRDH